jgi:hypothetical protein
VPEPGTLTLLGLGALGLAGTQGGGASLESDIQGAPGRLTVQSDIGVAFVSVTGAIGKVSVGGSLLGGAADDSRSIVATGDVGPVTIGGDLQRGTGDFTGSIVAGQNLAAVTVGGSLLGGAGQGSGSVVVTGAVGPVTVGGDLQGGRGPPPGQFSGPPWGGWSSAGTSGAAQGVSLGPSTRGFGIFGGGQVAGLTVGGSLVAATVPLAGFVTVNEVTGT